MVPVVVARERTSRQPRREGSAPTSGLVRETTTLHTVTMSATPPPPDAHDAPQPAGGWTRGASVRPGPPAAAPGSPWQAPGPPRQSRRSGAVLGVLLLLALGGGTTAVLVDRVDDQRAAHALADTEDAYDTALARLDGRLADLAEISDDIDLTLASATDDVDSAATLLDAADPDVVPEAERTALDTERTALSATVDSWAALDPAPERPNARPTAPAEIRDAAEQIDADAESVGSTVDDAQSALDALSTQRDELGAAAAALLATVPATSQTFVDTYTVATNASRSVMQVAAAGVGSSWSVDSSTQLAAFTGAAKTVVVSQGEQEQLLATPVHPDRPVVEAFARSLAGGVPIDVAWAPEVNGYGLDGTSGGYATWDTATYGYSTITLSDNVAERWPEEGVQALVAHETGHAITSKCYDIYAAPPFSSDDEVFATSWAISMGFDDGNGSGEWAYGRPSDEQIAAAAACR